MEHFDIELQDCDITGEHCVITVVHCDSTMEQGISTVDPVLDDLKNDEITKKREK